MITGSFIFFSHNAHYCQKVLNSIYFSEFRHLGMRVHARGREHVRFRTGLLRLVGSYAGIKSHREGKRGVLRIRAGRLR